MKLGIYALLLFAAHVVAAEQCDRLREYDAITATVTEKFYYRDFRGLDWPSRVEHYRVQVDCRGAERALATVVNRLLAELKASHTALYTADDLEYWALQSVFSQNLTGYEVAFSGIWPQRSNDAWYAKYVLSGSPAERAGVLAGDWLIGIDGREFHPLGFRAGAAATLAVSSRSGVRREVRLEPDVRSIQAFFLDAARATTRTIVADGRRAGYFHLWTGTHAAFLQSLNAALADFEAQRVDALILDFRGGFGGAGMDYIAQLKASSHLQGIPKYLLIDDGVRSGKEWVAATLKHERLATLVGSRTAGYFLGGSPFRFADNKYLLYLAVAGFVPPTGPIEGIGVEPDIAVAPCRFYCAGRDPQFDAVLELIKALPRAGA
jgi:carboxyl-terminal processing protease